MSERPSARGRDFAQPIAYIFTHLSMYVLCSLSHIYAIQYTIQYAHVCVLCAKLRAQLLMKKPKQRPLQSVEFLKRI